MSAWIAAAATVVGLLFALAAALGAYAVFKVNKQSTALATYKSNADEAEQNARIWKDRSEATQAELDSTVRELTDAQQQITELRMHVTRLEGIVTARAEVIQLVTVVSDLAKQVREDHKDQRGDHQVILAAIGGKS